MKPLIVFIMTEKEVEELCKMVRIGVDLSKPKFRPKTTKELRDIIKELIEERGNEADLNDVDVSKITDMSGMFYDSKFNGDISNWDVSGVEDMSRMFENSKFNGDISKWNVKEIVNMERMFANNKSANIPDWCPNKSLLRTVLSFLMRRYPDPEKSFWRPLYTVLIFLINMIVLVLLCHHAK